MALFDYLRLLLMFVPILLVFAAVAAVRRADRKHGERFRAAALTLGWSDDGVDGGPPEEVTRLRLFQEGYARRFTAVLRGRVGRLDALLFEYRYTVGGGRHSKTHKQTVMAIELPGAGLPEFQLRPEHSLHRLAGVFGYQDIDLQSFPRFSKSYLLRGPDESAIRSLFGDSIVHHLEANPGWSVEGSGSWLVVYRASRREKPDNLHEFTLKCEVLASTFLEGMQEEAA
jgi:hypothetical protein